MTDNWSPSEKKIARRAFDKGLRREEAELVAAFKRNAASATDFDGLWEIESWLKARRREIDDKYDYRYSQMIIVLATLKHQKFIGDDDLTGLAADKIAKIELLLSFRDRG
jgi:hypothetical protein